jgi:GNAT superfamily N-acetyltransferase
VTAGISIDQPCTQAGISIIQARTQAGISIVRARTETECERVRPLAQAHAAYERSATVLVDDWSARISRMITAGRLHLVIALRGDEAVGYATTVTTVATWAAAAYAELDCLFVHEGTRGAGVGALLVEAAADVAREDGCLELQWQTPSWNEGAIRFYQRLGARSTSKERFTVPLSVPTVTV